MEKENGERDKSTPGDANHLVDPLAMFAGHSMFGGGLAGYGHHLTSAYNALLAGGRAGQYASSPLPPTTSSYGSLGTLSVAASQAASLGMNSANAAWWSMASQLAAQDYLQRLQASGIQFPGMPVDMSGFPLMSPQQHSHGGSGGKQSHGKSSSSAHGSHLNSSLGSSHHRERDSSTNTHKNQNLEGHGRMKSSAAASTKAMMSHAGLPPMLNDPGSLLGGVRLPPDTEIIKYTSSIVGPKVPGTTNRGRKKTISLDPPSVSMTPSQAQLAANTSVSPSQVRKQQHKPAEERPTNLTVSTHSPRPLSLDAEHSELSELMKLSNGQLTPQASPVPGGYHTPPARALTPATAVADCDAPLNLSLKPAPPSPASNNALQSLSSLSQSLGHMPDRISRRKPGPKPRRVSQSPLPPPGPAPSASLAQLFAAADTPRPSPSAAAPTSDDSDSMSLSHHKDGRPRNLGRGVSKPKKNTVASLLAQSRALGLKSGLDITSPLNHQVNLLKANILQQQLAAREGDSENEDKMGTSSSPGNLVEEMQERSKRLLQQRGLEELRALVQESQSETSSVPDISTDTNSSDSDSDKESSVSSKKREGDRLSDSATPPKKRKPIIEDESSEADMRLPLQLGWKRDTLVRGLGKHHTLKGDVTYFAPDGHVFKQFPEVQEYLDKNKITELGQHNFSFSPKVLIGEFIHNILDGQTQKVSGREMSDILEKLKNSLKLIENYRALHGISTKSDKERAKETKKAEAARSKELTRMLKDEERNAKQEALKKEREQRNIQAMEARRKRQEEAGKLKQEEQLRKQQEREIKRQQTAMIKEQELTKQRELLYTVELERERRRQHMAMVKSLEQRRRQEERERKRLEVKAEKMATREKRLEQRRIDMDLLEEIRKPIEDMELPDLKPLPDLKRIPGLKVCGAAFSEILMVFEFLHTYGETLGFDMGSLPTLNSLQNALLGEEEAEEELLSVMTHMVICAIEDPGIPNPARHTTLLGQSLKQADITHANISEILRIYLYANATGEVKSLSGVQFEREREKRVSDHHNNLIEGDDAEGGKNAAFFVALRENSTWKLSELLKKTPFLALNPTQKAKILEFLCHELLQNKAVMKQIDNAIETVAQLKRDRYTNESKLRKLRHLHNRKVRQMALGVVGGRLEGDDDPPPPPPKEHDDDEDGEGDSGNESDGTQPEEEEDKKLSIEEMARKLEKLNKQAEQTQLNLVEMEGQLRGVCYGQDRYYRRYWKFPTTGGLLVEGMESAEPDLFQEFLQRDDADSMETPDIKSEYEAEHREMKPLDDNGDDDDDEEMPHLTPEVDTETLLSKYKQEMNDHMDDEPAELPIIKPDKEENEAEKNGSVKETETEDSAMKNEFSGGEEDSETKSVSDDKKSQTFQMFQEKGEEDSSITNGQADSDPAWFNVVPREPCDNTSITATTSAFRCGIENSELRIPVFPPPPASPSPSQCDSPSPAPLALTAEESAQLEHCRMYGLPTLAPAKPVPYELRCGWWRITDPAELQQLVENLHTRGAREKDLRRNILRPTFGATWASNLKKCVVKGSPATELAVTYPGQGNTPPPPDGPEEWNYSVALRVDMAVLDQVEAMEDKVANASMQIKGWKVPPKANSEEGIQFKPSCSNPPLHLNPIHVAKNRLIDLEGFIERRYLKPPLGLNMSGVDASLNVSVDLDTVPKGLIVWRDAVAKSQTAAQLSMGLHMLEASIAWDKSIMKANCQFCHSGDNEDKLLLCDGCDKGYHTYCFKPKMDNIPDGDWYCYECMNKATGDKNCIVCGKKLGRNLVVCDNCPKAYHTDCLQPPLSKLPRGKWHCPTCMAKMPRKRLNAKRTISASFNSTSPCSSASRDDSVPNPEPVHSPMPAEELAPESPPPQLQPVVKKEKGSGKKMAKEMAPCKLLLEELETHDESWPFLLPVNTKQFPTYKKIIKNPMDLGTIRKRLQDSVYKSREEFAADVRLIFNNCETFNEDDSPVGKAGHHMRFFFESRYLELFQKPPS